MRHVGLVALLCACAPSSSKVVTVTENTVVEVVDRDADGDGYLASEECDDGNPNINPGQPEICDELDNNCDGEVDEGVKSQFYADVDQDGFGWGDTIVESCEAPEGMVMNGSDCDDDNNATYPGATEVCDGLDNNCDLQIDEGLGGWWYPDVDGDNYGDALAAIQSCEGIEGYIITGGDCDDANPEVFPMANEECDGIDNNCNDEIDEAGSITWYLDADGDQYGDINVQMQSCFQPMGYVDNFGDCDDIDPMRSPDQPEICDWVDNNCNGILDENALDALLWYVDADMDSFGSANLTTWSCTQPLGYAANSLDCDDARAASNPFALEFCNGLDDDCDGLPDDSDVVDAAVFYTDADGDGYGDINAPTQACTAPVGAVANNRDCNDASASIYPYATEYCNGQDDNCNNLLDEMAIDQTIFYADLDGDGYGSPLNYELACVPSPNFLPNADDCDDSSASIHPNAGEICNGQDDNCDGAIDEGIPTTPWYRDLDGDGFGNRFVRVYNCRQPTGYVTSSTDCTDTDNTIYPNALERCNGLDDDCDGDVDAGMLGEDEICVADSCLDILSANASAEDGEYFINFPTGIESTQCDMGSFGGGWTLVFLDEMNPPDMGWSYRNTYNCGIWGSILGGYGLLSGPNATVGMTQNTISTRSIPHAQVWVELDYITLDSWDGETAYVRLNGNNIWSQPTNNHTSIYGQVCGWYRPTYPIGSLDSRHYVSSIVNGYFPSITVRAGSTLDQSPLDESFGIDDVYVWVR